MIKYQVIITKITKEVQRQNDWQRLHSKESFDNKKEPQYGYIASDKEVETDEAIYTQTVKELDIVAVINAVNSGVKQ